MPEISRFFGIVIKMYYNDHSPPHFHAEYSGDQIVVNINTLGVIAGKLSARATSLVLEWAALHQAELLENWERAEDMNPLERIEPLT